MVMNDKKTACYFSLHLINYFKRDSAALNQCHSSDTFCYLSLIINRSISFGMNNDKTFTDCLQRLYLAI